MKLVVQHTIFAEVNIFRFIFPRRSKFSKLFYTILPGYMFKIVITIIGQKRPKTKDALIKK
jgi:hypothetical protein